MSQLKVGDRVVRIGEDCHIGSYYVFRNGIYTVYKYFSDDSIAINPSQVIYNSFEARKFILESVYNSPLAKALR